MTVSWPDPKDFVLCRVTDCFAVAAYSSGRSLAFNNITQIYFGEALGAALLRVSTPVPHALSLSSS